MKNRHPFSWVPTLYFIEALPNVAVATISVMMYKRLGISNSDIALYTGWLYLPWVIKLFWSPFIDIFRTKRWWTIVMQLLIGAGFAGIAFTIPTPFYFQVTLAFFWLLAFSSATHDIAADGFYMLALDSHQQALYVGIRSTFYRVATIFGQGLLVVLAGWLEAHSGLPPVNLTVSAGPNVVATTTERFSESPAAEQQFLCSTHTLTINTEKPAAQVTALADSLKKMNVSNGFTTAEEVKRKEIKPLNSFELWIKNTLGEEEQKMSRTATNIGVVEVRLNHPPKNDEEVVLSTILTNGDKSIELVNGNRLVFNAQNASKTAYLLFRADPNLKANTTATFKGASGNIPFAWSIVFFILAGLTLFFTAYHKWILPKPIIDKADEAKSMKDVFRKFGETFATFFTKEGILAALAFMLLFRLPEAQLVKLVNPFLLDPSNVGGLALTTGQVGWIYGTVGMLGLTIGGILGGMAVARHGLKRWLWPMVLSISLPDLVYIYLSYVQTDNLWLVSSCVFIEQFGYGFGFTAYMLYLIYFSRGQNSTAHYAMCTAFMALGMMLPGMMAGWLEELLGYRHFFIWVMVCCFVTVGVASLLKIDPEFGKKQKPT